MKITTTGVELTWAEFAGFTSMIAQAKDVSETVAAIPAAAPRATPAKDHPWRKDKATSKHKGRKPLPRVAWHSPGDCPTHGRKLVKDPQDGTFNCPVCLDAADDFDNDDDQGDA